MFPSAAPPPLLDHFPAFLAVRRHPCQLQFCQLPCIMFPAREQECSCRLFHFFLLSLSHIFVISSPKFLFVKLGGGGGRRGFASSWRDLWLQVCYKISLVRSMFDPLAGRYFSAPIRFPSPTAFPLSGTLRASSLLSRVSPFYQDQESIFVLKSALSADI